MEEEPVLSVIMPCYNGAGTIVRALDSVLIQRFTYPYEIVVVDDGSMDNSRDIVASMAAVHPQIKQYINEQNMGNAITFYRGLTYSRGKYFCVLDVDDYYSVRDKLQKQVDFLESDTEQEYVAVTHSYVIDLQDDSVNIPDSPRVDEFNYIDIINQRSGYYHTATYVYRNIFRGRVPELFMLPQFRGDTVRTIIHLMYSNKKVKVLNFVGSVYNWSMEGIWSSISQKKQFDIQIGIWKGLKEMCCSDLERKAYDKLINQCEVKQNQAEDIQRTYPAVKIEDALKIMCRYAGKYAFEQHEYTFNGLYYSEYLDSLAATLGCVYRQHHPEFVQNVAHEKTMCIILSTLKPKGGGIFREMTEIVEMFSNWDVHLISTERSPSDSEYKEELSGYANLTVHILPEGYGHKLHDLSSILIEVSPSRIYFYDSHDDMYPFAAIQDGVATNVCLFSFDHGFVSGLSSPNLDTIISKRRLDYTMLRHEFGDKVIYIPAWNDTKDSIENFEYVPFDGHDKLITACGAARFYKLESTYGLSYVDVVLSILKLTGGQHIHYGPIPDEQMDYIRNYIKDNGLGEDAFVHIEWAEDPIALITDSKVDLFIEPFPIVSYKITLDALMCGIPIIAFDGDTRMSTVDFMYEGSLHWRTRENLLRIIGGLTPEVLLEHSRRSKEYFAHTHKKSVVESFYKENRGIPAVLDCFSTDNTAHDIRGYEQMFQNGHIRMATVMNSGGVIDASNNHSSEETGEGASTFRVRRALHRFNRFIKRKMGGNMNHKINQNEVRALYQSSNVDDNDKAFLQCKSCKDSDPHALIWLSRMYRNGIGTEKDLNKAVSSMETAIAAGMMTARNELVDVLLERNAKGDAVKAFLVAKGFAEDGDGPASGRLAKMYRDGVGTEKDEEEARKWTIIAAERNVTWAKRECIDIFKVSEDKEDQAKAFSYAKELAEVGDAGSCGRLARMYRDGVGVEKNLDAAIEWMTQAEAKNVRWAKKELLDMLIERGTEKDKDLAFTMAKELAEAGDAGSCGRLARMYRDGRGTVRDLKTAKKWMAIAAEKNVGWAEKELKEMNSMKN